MAENKKSFIAYSDWNGMFKALPDDVAGKLIKHVFSYVNDENPESDDYIINALFEQIKATLKRDLNKWDKQREQRSLAGKKSAEIRATKSNERSTKSNETVRKSTVSVNDSVNVSDSDIQKKKVFNFRISLLEYGFDKTLVDDWLIVRKKKKASNTETAFKGFIKQVELCGLPINQILTECVNNSWSGFKKAWLDNILPQEKTETPTLPYPNIREFMIFIRDKSRIQKDVYEAKKRLLENKFDVYDKNGWLNWRKEKITNWQVEVLDNIHHWIK